jgi:hypothetical protein
VISPLAEVTDYLAEHVIFAWMLPSVENIDVHSYREEDVFPFRVLPAKGSFDFSKYWPALQ